MTQHAIRSILWSFFVVFHLNDILQFHLVTFFYNKEQSLCCCLHNWLHVAVMQGTLCFFNTSHTNVCHLWKALMMSPVLTLQEI